MWKNVLYKFEEKKNARKGFLYIWGVNFSVDKKKKRDDCHITNFDELGNVRLWTEKKRKEGRNTIHSNMR